MCIIGQRFLLRFQDNRMNKIDKYKRMKKKSTPLVTTFSDWHVCKYFSTLLDLIWTHLLCKNVSYIYLRLRDGDAGGRNWRVRITKRPSPIKMHGVKRDLVFAEEIADSCRNILPQSSMDAHSWDSVRVLDTWEGVGMETPCPRRAICKYRLQLNMVQT